MWGKKGGEQTDRAAAQAQDGTSSSRPTSQDIRDPDERTRLLPARPSRQDGYLDPDDPAVSPYNLWTVRFIRYLTVLFTAITFVWWVLLLVSIFVSPPGMNTRGSGYTDFAYTSLTLGNLIVALVFFSGPSMAMRISLTIVAFLLLADMIIIAAVTRIRFEEGWVGVASAIWAVLIAVWCVITDRVVEWGKHEEEERLTGRPETRRSLTQWLAVLVGTVILFVFILITVLLTATLILRSIDAGLEPDGERFYVDGDKYQVHLNCVGNETDSKGRKVPTVLLESGEDPVELDFEHWAYGAYQNGTIPRYCYWDRPGYAWSDDAPSPHSAGMSADALSEALAVAGETGPWISVSAGYGSVVARIFCSRHTKEVSAIMMIDPLHEDLLHRIGTARDGFVLWGYGVISPLGIQRIAGALFNGRTKEDRTYGRSAIQTGKFLKAKLQENLVADSLTRSEVVAARNIQTESTPVVIVSSGIEVRRDSEWEHKQEDLSHYTDKLVSWDVVGKAPHEVWRTDDGVSVLSKRVGELVKIAKK